MTKVFSGFRLPSRLREILVVLFLLGGFSVFAFLTNEHLPFKDWLFFRYASYFASALVLVTSCLALGLPFLKATWGRNTPLVERLVLSLPIGLFLFTFIWTLLGFLHLLGFASAILLPLIAIGLGARELKRAASQALRLRRRAIRRGPGWSTVEMSLCALGVVGLLLVYAPLMTPQNASFDARWYHLPLAERYALEGAIVPYKEGWFIAGAPQLASLIYSWCFSLPFSTTFDHVELCQHVEFLFFVCTIASVPLLVRKVVPKRVRVPRNTWAVVFFFPGVFVFDSGLGGGADHFAALWAIPLFLVSIRAYRNLSLRTLLPLGVLVSAIMTTKFTALGLLVGPGLALGFRFVQLAIKGPNSPARVALGSRLLLFFSLLLIGTSPYWLKNWLWYGNPFFPLLAESFPTRPWTSQASARLTAMSDGSAWIASRDWDGFLTTLSQLYKFSFVPNNWSTFHRDLPVFGSLFTLLTPVLLLLRTKRLVLLVLTASASVLFWYWTFHQDRYLQAYVPWMAAAVAGISILVWHQGLGARVALTLLVALQLVWGGDAPFFGTHTLAGQPLQATIQLLSAGFHGKREERFVAYPDMERVREVVDKKSLILRHENQMHLGLGVPSATDWFQSGISWAAAGGPRGVHEKLQEIGVTHLMWQPGKSRAVGSVGGDLVFFDYATNYAENSQKVGSLSVAEVAKTVPQAPHLPTLFLGCNTDYQNGLYEAAQLKEIPFHGSYPRRTVFPSPIKSVDQANVVELLQEARGLAWDEQCFPLRFAPSRFGYERVAKRARLSLWIAPTH